MICPSVCYRDQTGETRNIRVLIGQINTFWRQVSIPLCLHTHTHTHTQLSIHVTNVHLKHFVWVSDRYVNTRQHLRAKSKVHVLNQTPCHKGIWESGGIAPRILHISIWELTSWPLYHRFIGQGTRWGSRVVTFILRPICHWYELDRGLGRPQSQNRRV
jgi:hypothetical protein